jgi:hypothetical protein
MHSQIDMTVIKIGAKEHTKNIQLPYIKLTTLFIFLGDQCY